MNHILPGEIMTKALFLSGLLTFSLFLSQPVMAQTPPAIAKLGKSALKPNADSEDRVLKAVLSGPQRSPAHTARDIYRHPYESLTFWGLQPGLTVLEVEPGGETWWSEILAPYAAQTGGHYIATGPDRQAKGLDAERLEKTKAAHARFLAKLGDKAVFGSVETVDLGKEAGLRAPAASVDLILVARAFHNWAGDGITDTYMQSFARALKSGGILAVEQHRAQDGSDPKAGNGYVPESYVIEAAKKAGLVLEARSEINANPKDTKNHPFGVWTLPPFKRTSPFGQPDNPNFDRTRFDAIGESDRMTLRFRKP